MLPAVGKPVRVVKGESAGEYGELRKLHTKRFLAEVAIDASDGTIEGTTQHLDLSTRCYDDALQCARLDELKRDLEFVASPLVPQDTFWLGEGESPRCALEAVALETIRKHAAASPHAADPKSGVEWWAQVKDPTANQEAAREVCFHWDKDEQAHTLHGMYVFPQLATVTYLSEGGAPTVVLDKRPDSFTGAIAEGPVDAAAACRPHVGRHLVFDGRGLHAAPLALAISGASNKRYTFLVNVWLGHRPSGIRPFPAAALDKLTRDGASMRFGAATAPVRGVEGRIRGCAALQAAVDHARRLRRRVAKGHVGAGIRNSY